MATPARKKSTTKKSASIYSQALKKAAKSKVTRKKVASAISKRTKKTSPTSSNLSLPENYDKTYIHLIARDPFWIHAYWEISSSSVALLKKKIGKDFVNSEYVLRFYDVTLIDFNGENAHHWFDIVVGVDAKSWYVNLWRDHVSYCAEIGLKTPNGRFFALARSNAVMTPRAQMSERMDPVWMEVKEEKPSLPFIYIPKDSGQTRLPAVFFKESYRRRRYLTKEELEAYYTKSLSHIKKARSQKKTIPVLRTENIDSLVLQRSRAFRSLWEKSFKKTPMMPFSSASNLGSTAFDSQFGWFIFLGGASEKVTSR